MSPSPSVLFVDQAAEIGGAELSLIDIVRWRKGPQTVCLMQPGPFAERLREFSVPTVLVDASGILNVRRDDGLAAAAGAIPALLRILRGFASHARRHDVVYANTMKAIVLAALSYPLHRRPVIWHLRDLLTAEHFSAGLRMCCSLLPAFAIRRVIANSQATAEAYRRIGGRSPVEVVYNGIDPAAFDAIDAAEARARLLSETRLAGDRPIVGVFSRLARWKGQHVLVEALKSVPDLQAVIVGGALFGEDAYEAQLRSDIAAAGLEDRVRLLGFRRDVPVLMKGVDIVAHTSTAAEPFGRVIIEGMLAGKPVVAMRAGGAVELIRDGETGVLVAPGDAGALAEALRQFLADPVEASRMAEQGASHARETFGVRDYVLNIDKAINAALSR
ncbi:glycosyltransferase [Ancylobacter sp. VNQ12]|uniref:glycosyltransferase n=1 Tax=Ancylobacter sp. VNQ12 TaxID=3400920 RepID=UPI003C0E2E63